MLAVERAQLALGLAGRGRQPLRGGLGAAERRVGPDEAAEDVVPVAVGGEQAGDLPARLRKDGGQCLELLREDGRVDDERLARPVALTAVDHRAGGLPDPADADDDVRVEGEDPQSPRSFAASRSVLTSSVGFFWLGSSCSLFRLTQITGTLSFAHGSTSW